MASAGEWVRQIIANAQDKPMSTEAVLKSLERQVGQGDKMVTRLQDIVDYIDNELIDRKGGQVMRDLWATVVDYQEKVQEARAAA